MAFSIQTNVNALIAQENLRVNSEFQSRTIQRLTSGYRINQSGDDAAGLAIANKFRSDIAEINQGVRNANDGVAQLQIIDGGMNNISKMLDRLKTLASQSASDTFTGDRSVLNQEFQSLLSEIDRQAQAIGLDTNGQFAASLKVFIGGGRAHGTGTASTENGSVTLDLRSSTVDTNSLGLKGMQLVAGTEDIGAGSAAHTVAQIIADSTNTTAQSGYTDLYFSGAGFSGADKIKVTVNLAGVTDVDTLATAINDAIDAAGNGSTQAATAFANANVVASVNTDANGGSQLAFTSANSAFQVQAGDRMANAFMGNLTGTVGTAIAATVAGGNTAATTTAFVPTGVTVRITGAGLDAPVDITFEAGSTTVDDAITDLIGKVSADANLQAAGITVDGTAGGPLTFTSARGEKVSVMATGDTSNILGLGSFAAGASSAVDYQTISGTYNNATAYGTAVLEFSFDGAASNGNAISIDLAAGDAAAGTHTGNVAGTVADQTGLTLILSVDGGGDQTVTFGATTTIALAAEQINAQTTGLTATVDASGYLKLTSDTKGASSNVTISAAGTMTETVIGLTAASYDGTSRTGADLQNALNAAFAADAEMQAAGLEATFGAGTLSIASNNGTYFRVNAGPSGANADIGFGVDGATFTSSLTVAAASASMASADGVSNTTSLAYSDLSYGNDDQAITISANDTAGALQSKTITLKNDSTTTRSGRSIDEAISYINSQLQQSNNATLQKIVAVKEIAGGAEKINFISSLDSFTVGVGSSGNAHGIANGSASLVESDLLGDATTISVGTQAAALQAVNAIATAVDTLGSAQGAVGRGQNQLGYAIGLAQSQVSNFSAAESRIRDADIAQEAANLTKAQVLQQASMAAMAQANSAPQAVLSLLRG